MSNSSPNQQFLSTTCHDPDGIQLHSLHPIQLPTCAPPTLPYHIRIKSLTLFKPSFFSFTRQLYEIEVTYMLARFTIRRTWEEVLELYDGLRQRWEDVVLPGLRANGIKIGEAGRFQNREARRRLAQRFLDGVMRVKEIRGCKCIAAFLSNTETFKLPPIQKAITPKQQPFTFLPPPTPSSLTLPTTLPRLATLTASYLTSNLQHLSLNHLYSSKFSILFPETEALLSANTCLEGLLERMYWLALDLAVWEEVMRNGGRDRGELGEMEAEFARIQMEIVEVVMDIREGFVNGRSDC